MKIIGVLGPAGVGKSTLATYLVEKYGARRYSLAHPLKKIVRQAFDLTKDQVWGSQMAKEAVDPRYNVSARWLLQRIGTEGIRNTLGPDFWWEICMQQILDDAPELAVIDDFRFTNEVNGFLSLNMNLDPKYPMVHIWRIDTTRVSESSADATHQSEAEWSACAFTETVKPEESQEQDEDGSLRRFYDAIDETAYASGLTVATDVLK